jgi:hypothetical protein
MGAKRKERNSMATLNSKKRNDLRKRSFAFPKQRKEPLEDAGHVRNAIARFSQVEGVSDAERDEAWTRIQAAAKKFGVEVEEASWRGLGKEAGKSRKKRCPRTASSTTPCSRDNPA